MDTRSTLASLVLKLHHNVPHLLLVASATVMFGCQIITSESEVQQICLFSEGLVLINCTCIEMDRWGTLEWSSPNFDCPKNSSTNNNTIDLQISNANCFATNGSCTVYYSATSMCINDTTVISVLEFTAESGPEMRFQCMFRDCIKSYRVTVAAVEPNVDIRQASDTMDACIKISLNINVTTACNGFNVNLLYTRQGINQQVNFTLLEYTQCITIPEKVNQSTNITISVLSRKSAEQVAYVEKEIILQPCDTTTLNTCFNTDNLPRFVPHNTIINNICNQSNNTTRCINGTFSGSTYVKSPDLDPCEIVGITAAAVIGFLVIVIVSTSIILCCYCWCTEKCCFKKSVECGTQLNYISER